MLRPSPVWMSWPYHVIKEPNRINSCLPPENGFLPSRTKLPPEIQFRVFLGPARPWELSGPPIATGCGIGSTSSAKAPSNPAICACVGRRHATAPVTRSARMLKKDNTIQFAQERDRQPRPSRPAIPLRSARTPGQGQARSAEHAGCLKKSAANCAVWYSLKPVSGCAQIFSPSAMISGAMSSRRAGRTFPAPAEPPPSLAEFASIAPPYDAARKRLVFNPGSTRIPALAPPACARRYCA